MPHNKCEGAIFIKTPKYLVTRFEMYALYPIPFLVGTDDTQYTTKKTEAMHHDLA